MSTESEALLKLYHCINGPVSAGRVKVVYSRQQVDAMIEVLQQIMSLHGFDFKEPSRP